MIRQKGYEAYKASYCVNYMLLDWKYTIILLNKYKGNLLKAQESGLVY